MKQIHSNPKIGLKLPQNTTDFVLEYPGFSNQIIASLLKPNQIHPIPSRQLSLNPINQPLTYRKVITNKMENHYHDTQNRL